MIPYPNFSPDIARFSLLGMNLQIRWYGLFYVISFLLGFLLFKHNLKLRDLKLPREQYESAIFHVMLGVILGGRLGYVLFYNLPFYFQHPGLIFAVWEGGMSFHGGALGVIIAGLLYARRYKLPFLALADAAVPLVAIGLGLGRLGNFVNAELWGKPTSLPWGMIFPGTEGVPRHPTQLYELFLEGILMCALTYWLLRRFKRPGVVFFSFIGLYGIFRFLIEFVRQPDDISFYTKFGFIFGFMTIGQFLSFLMILAGIYGIWRLYRKPPLENKET